MSRRRSAKKRRRSEPVAVKSMPMRKRSVTLMPFQQPHCAAMLEQFRTEPWCPDTSPMGSGKTYIGCAIAQILELDLIVVSAKSVASVWPPVAHPHGLKLEFHTFQGLRGQHGGHRLNHGLLIRDDSACLARQFRVTAEFLRRVQSGILLVIDEAHLIRNDTAERRAVAALIHAIVAAFYANGSTRSRVLPMSGTFLNRHEQVPLLMHTLGMLPTPYLLDEDDDDFKHRAPCTRYEHLKINKPASGLHHLCSMAAKLDPDATRSRVSKHSPCTTAADAHAMAFDLFCNVIQKHRSSHMPPAPLEASALDCKLLFCRLDSQQSLNALRTLTRRLATGFHINVDAKASATTTTTSRVLRPRETLIADLVALDLLKVPMMVRWGLRHLATAGTKSKLVLCVNYLPTVHRLTVAFSAFRPLVVQAHTSKAERATIFAAFQSNAARSPRVLIATQQVLAFGISLHDQHGDAPRMLGILPSFFGMNLEQVTARVYRLGLKSVATVRFFYCMESSSSSSSSDSKEGTSLELSLQASHARSTAVTHALHHRTFDILNLPRIVEGEDVVPSSSSSTSSSSSSSSSPDTIQIVDDDDDDNDEIPTSSKSKRLRIN